MPFGFLRSVDIGGDGLRANRRGRGRSARAHGGVERECHVFAQAVLVIGVIPDLLRLDAAGLRGVDIGNREGAHVRALDVGCVLGLVATGEGLARDGVDDLLAVVDGGQLVGEGVAPVVALVQRDGRGGARAGARAEDLGVGAVIGVGGLEANRERGRAEAVLVIAVGPDLGDGQVLVAGRVFIGDRELARVFARGGLVERDCVAAVRRGVAGHRRFLDGVDNLHRGAVVIPVHGQAGPGDGAAVYGRDGLLGILAAHEHAVGEEVGRGFRAQAGGVAIVVPSLGDGDAARRGRMLVGDGQDRLRVLGELHAFGVRRGIAIDCGLAHGIGDLLATIVKRQLGEGLVNPRVLACAASKRDVLGVRRGSAGAKHVGRAAVGRLGRDGEGHARRTHTVLVVVIVPELHQHDVAGLEAVDVVEVDRGRLVRNGDRDSVQIVGGRGIRQRISHRKIVARNVVVVHLMRVDLGLKGHVFDFPRILDRSAALCLSCGANNRNGRIGDAGSVSVRNQNHMLGYGLAILDAGIVNINTEIIERRLLDGLAPVNLEALREYDLLELGRVLDREDAVRGVVAGVIAFGHVQVVGLQEAILVDVHQLNALDAVGAKRDLVAVVVGLVANRRRLGEGVFVGVLPVIALEGLADVDGRDAVLVGGYRLGSDARAREGERHVLKVRAGRGVDFVDHEVGIEDIGHDGRVGDREAARLVAGHDGLVVSVGNDGLVDGVGDQGAVAFIVVGVFRQVRPGVGPAVACAQGNRGAIFAAVGQELDADGLRAVVARTRKSLQIGVVPDLGGGDARGFELVGEDGAVCVIAGRRGERAVTVVDDDDGHGLFMGVVFNAIGLGAVGGHEFLDGVGVGPGAVTRAEACGLVGLNLGQVVGDSCKVDVSAANRSIGLLVDDVAVGVSQLKVEHVGPERSALERLGGPDSGCAGCGVLVGEDELFEVARSKLNPIGIVARNAVHGNDLDVALVVFLDGDGHQD